MLDLFNEALLAKQLWRLHSHPDSLLAQTLKSKYYPKISVWEACLGHNPSFVWRSVWGSRPLLSRGVRWRVGVGKSIGIWKDAWLGGDGQGKIITPPPPSMIDAHVHKLIDPIRNSWNLNMLQNLFLPCDVVRIL